MCSLVGLSVGHNFLKGHGIRYTSNVLSEHMFMILTYTLRFSAAHLRPNDTSRFHGANERISIDNFAQVIKQVYSDTALKVALAKFNYYFYYQQNHYDNYRRYMIICIFFSSNCHCNYSKYFYTNTFYNQLIMIIFCCNKGVFSRI